jgi:hypothetical protein
VAAAIAVRPIGVRLAAARLVAVGVTVVLVVTTVILAAGTDRPHP